jgi:serine/threonine protein kinase
MHMLRELDGTGFKLLQLINEGSQGCIYRGINTNTNERVVLKKLSKNKGMPRIKDEIKANEMMNEESGTCLFHGHIETEDDVVSRCNLTLDDVC